MMPNGFRGGEMKQRHYCYAGNATTVSAKSPNQKQVIDIIRFMHLIRRVLRPTIQIAA